MSGKMLTSFAAALLLVGCSSGGNSDTPPATIDLNGSWRSACDEADTAQALVDTVYFYRQLTINGDTIDATALPFSDSDCVTAFTGAYQFSGFSGGTYTLGQAFTTGSGLTAYPVTLTGNDTVVIENIIGRIDNTLYFGFDPLIDSVGSAAPTELDLEDGYQLQ